MTYPWFARASVAVGVGLLIVVFSSEGEATPRRPAYTLPAGCAPAGKKFQCNPRTNEGCDRAKGEACDDDDHGGFNCYPGPNSVIEGGKCDDDNGCLGGFGCDTDDGDDEGVCKRYCCSDAECGAKKCIPNDKAFGTLGFCD